MARAVPRGPRRPVVDRRDGTLLDLVDNVLNKGVVLNGELMLSLASVDLVYARLSVLLCAADFVLPTGESHSSARLRVRKQEGGDTA